MLNLASLAAEKVEGARWKIHQMFLDRHRPWFAYEITPEVLLTGRPPDDYPK